MDMTVADGRRCSAANAYLRPAMRRQNLTVRTHALATRVLFEGRRAIGVRYQRHGGTHEVRARREVLLCAGPINTPQLLKLSGVGPGEELAALGHRRGARAARSGREPAGSPGVLLSGGSREPVTLYGQMSPWRRALIGVRWLLTRGGSRQQQPLRDRRLHPQPRRRALPRHPVPFPAAGGELRRLRRSPASTASRHTSGRCARAARDGCGCARRIRSISRASASTTCRGAEDWQRDARLRAPDARDLRAAGIRSLSRPRDPARRARAER